MTESMYWTDMIDLEACPAEEFKCWVLDNVVRRITPFGLRVALYSIQRHGFRLHDFSQDYSKGCRFLSDMRSYRRLPQLGVKVTYEYDKALMTGPSSERDWISDAVMTDLLAINGTDVEVEFDISHERRVHYIPAVGFYFDEPPLLRIVVRFTVLNYDASDRAFAGDGDGLRDVQAGGNGHHPLLAGIHPQAA